MFPLRYTIAVLFLSVFIAGEAAAQNMHYQKQFEPFLTRGKTTWSIKGGLRNNKTDFQTASDITGTATPNIQFEGTFRDVTFLDIAGKVRHEEPADIGFIEGDLVAEAEIRGGVMVDGFHQISIYTGDDRTAEGLRKFTNTLNGDAIGAEVGLGYKIYLNGTPGYRPRQLLASKRPRSTRGRMARQRAISQALYNAGPYFSITPIGGYAYDQQNYYIDEVVELIPNALEKYSTEADYITNWYGPYVGLEGEVKNRKHQLRLRGKFYDLSYDTNYEDYTTNTTLKQEADGMGYSLSAEYAYALGEDYALTLEGYYQKRETDEGTNVITTDGVSAAATKLYEIDEESNALRLGFTYNWD